MYNVLVANLKYVFVDLIGDFLYWPIWWYTQGLWHMARFSYMQLEKMWYAQALGIWFKSMFTPMFGDRSILGRAISFGVRIVVLVWKSIWFILWSVLVAALFLVWILAPVAIVYMVVINIKK